MISFEFFTPGEGIPLYLQIVLYLKRGIAMQEIRDGDELPSRRVLSALLGVNPGTVQKAYHMLEEEGLLISSQGAKSYMHLREDTTARIRKELLSADVGGVVHSLKQMGYSLEEALDLMKKLWSET